MLHMSMNDLRDLGLQVAVDDFNATVAELGDAVRVSHYSRGGREWEFEGPDVLIAKGQALGVAMQVNPLRKVWLDRRTKRLVIR